MKVIDSECIGLADAQVTLAAALVDNASDQDQLLAWAKTIWPDLQVYYGHAHLRCFIRNETGDSPSFYVDFTESGRAEPAPFPFKPAEGSAEVFKTMLTKRQATDWERDAACAQANPALKRLIRIMANKTGQSYKIRALLYSLYSDEATSLLDTVCLDWPIKKDLNAVVLAFGYENPKTNTHFFYKALESAIQSAGLWAWFVESGANN
jgi:hypothetical protein